VQSLRWHLRLERLTDSMRELEIIQIGEIGRASLVHPSMHGPL
jgi:hypothetical protein